MNFMKKSNTYLLENYPLIWNTRLVWMLGASMLSHILFFIIGYFTVNNQEDIQAKYNLEDFYFDEPVVFFNILLSFLIIIIWILYYVQNNAFKNLYNIKKGMLFGQLSIIIVIVFMNINQYYSFNQGLKFKIRSLYSWEEIDADIKQMNKQAVFFIQNYNDYKLKEKAYPAPFPLFHKKTRESSLLSYIDTSKTYFKIDEYYYQFFNIDYDLIKRDKELNKLAKLYDSLKIENGYGNILEARLVEDVSKYKEDVKNCLPNFSKTLYSYGQDSLAYKNRLQFYEGLFKRADENEIKENLQLFLNLAKKYKIEHNLNIEEWYSLLDGNNYTYTKILIDENTSGLIYEIQKQKKERKNYQVYQTILKSKPTEDQKNKFTKKIIVENRVIENREKRYFKKGPYAMEVKGSKTYSQYEEVSLFNIPYLNLGYLDRFFSNTYDAYQSNDKLMSSIYFYILLSFILGLLLFLFKITDIKTLLLSFVTAAVILIITGLLIRFLSLKLEDTVTTSEIEKWVLPFMSVIIIVLSIVSIKYQWKKIITAILFSITLFVIPFMIGFLFEGYKSSIPHKIRETNAVYNWLKTYIFWIIIVFWIFSIAVYTKAIRKWKALPE